MGIHTLMRRKYLINIILAALAIGIMAFYATCSTSCSYLTGSVLGLDLKYAGVLFMALLIALSLLKKDLLLQALLSLAIGAEVILVGFQVRNDVYCPFCLSFGVILVLLFLLNMDIRRKWITALFIVLGFIAFLAFFKGSAIPTYSIT